MAQNPAQKTARKSAKKGKGKLAFLVVIALLIGLGLYWRETSLIRTIDITGVSDDAKPAIIERSGIKAGMRIEDIDTNRVSLSLGGLGGWEFLGMETEGKQTVRLHMRTRFERAMVHYAGSTYVLDDYGQVMEKLAYNPQYSLMEIRGMEIQSADVGKELGTVDKNQIMAVSKVILALDATGAYSHVRELNASDLDNLYMITVNGLRVNVGDSENMEIKCRWMLGVLDSLAAEGVYSGTIDVSTGASGVYTPN